MPTTTAAAAELTAGYHAAVIPVENVAATLGAWPVRVESVTPLTGGWNSATWLAVTAQGRYVAKLVDDLDAAALVSGLQVAEFRAARGL